MLPGWVEHNPLLFFGQFALGHLVLSIRSRYPDHQGKVTGDVLHDPAQELRRLFALPASEHHRFLP